MGLCSGRGSNDPLLRDCRLECVRDGRSVDVNGSVFSCIANAFGPSVVDRESVVRH